MEISLEQKNQTNVILLTTSYSYKIGLCVRYGSLSIYYSFYR